MSNFVGILVVTGVAAADLAATSERLADYYKADQVVTDWQGETLEDGTLVVADEMPDFNMAAVNVVVFDYGTPEVSNLLFTAVAAADVLPEAEEVLTGAGEESTSE